MARPTSDKKDSKVILRINGETRAFIEAKAKEMGCSISDCVRNLISVVQNSSVIQNMKNSSVIQNNTVVQNTLQWDLPEEVMNDTESMGEFFNMTLGELVTEFNRMLNEGEISSEDKKLYCVLPNWAQEMADACHDAGVSVESVGKKVTGMIQRGQI